MPRNGSGSYTPPSTVNPVQPNTVITSDWANQTVNDIGAALTASIARDGQTIPIADLPMGGYKHTNVGSPTARTHYASVATTQDMQDKRVVLSGAGTANNLSGSCSIGAPTTYANGMLLWFVPLLNNTGAVTININSIGAKSILNKLGDALVADDLVTGRVYYIYYDALIGGTGAFQVLNEISGADRIAYQNIISGWTRPDGGTYPTITVAGTDVTIPAGTGTIVSPDVGGVDGSEFTTVSWGAITEALSNIGVSSSTTLAIDSTGALVQIAGRPSAADYRDNIIVGYVAHPGSATPVPVTAPAVRADNGYLFRDTTAVFENNLISGGKMSAGVAAQTLVVANGYALKAGGTPNTPSDMNVLAITGANPITMKHFNGTNDANYGAGTTTLDVANYDPAWATNGALVGLGANEWAFHRLYNLYGTYIVVYGQNKYTSATVAGAIAFFDYDSSKFTTPVLLSDAVYMGAIMVSAAAVGAVLDNGTSSLIISKGSVEFGIKSAYSVGFLDAPADGSTYGRNNNAWVTTVGTANPAFTGNASLTGNNSMLSIRNTGAGESGITLEDSTGTVTADITRDSASGNVLFSGYNGVTLTSQWTWNPITGAVDLGAGSTIDGAPMGDVTGPASTTDSAFAMFDGTSGKLLKEGPVVQPTPYDTTAGQVLQNGSYGLGTTSSLVLPSGTDAERLNLFAGEFRHNSQRNQLEWNYGFGYVPIYLTAPSGISGLAMYTPAGQWANQFTVLEGFANKVIEAGGLVNRGGFLTAPMTKTLSVWAQGSGNGARADIALSNFQNKWAGVFLVWNDALDADIGIDVDWEAQNLLAFSATTFQYYRRIGWVLFDAAGTNIRGFYADASGNVVLHSPIVYSVTVATAVQTVTGIAPTRVVADLSTYVSADSGSPNTTLNAVVYNDDMYSTTPASTSLAQVMIPTYSGQRSSGTTSVKVRMENYGATNSGRVYVNWLRGDGGSVGSLTASCTMKCSGWFDDRVAANKNLYP